MIIKLAIYLKKTFWFLWALYRLRTVFWANVVTNKRIRPDEVSIRGAGLYLPKIGLTLNADSYLYILDDLRVAEQLHTFAGARFSWSKEDKLVVKVNDLSFYVTSVQLLQLLREVYIEGMYDINIPGQVVVIDVGMYEGVVSLFLADKLKTVTFAYEPFAQTFQNAQQNLSLNATVSPMIRAHNFGLGASRAVVETLFCPESSGCCGVIPVPEKYHVGKDVFKESIDIYPVLEVIDSVCKEFPDKDILLKLDCEGSEYDILESIFGNYPNVHKIRSIILEWHKLHPSHDPNNIVKLLGRHGFTVLNRGAFTADVGMIYAQKYV